MTRAPLLPLLLVATLALAACGSGGDDGTTGTTSGGTGGTTTTTSGGTGGTTDTSAATGSDVAVSGTGYGFELPGRDWADQKANPQLANQNYDIVYVQRPPGASGLSGRVIVETIRRPIPASEAGKPGALDLVLRGTEDAAKQGGNTLGEARDATLAGEKAKIVTLDGSASSGGGFAGILVVAIHDDAVYSLTFVGPTAKRSDLPALLDRARATWRWR